LTKKARETKKLEASEEGEIPDEIPLSRDTAKKRNGAEQTTV